MSEIIYWDHPQKEHLPLHQQTWKDGESSAVSAARMECTPPSMVKDTCLKLYK